MGIKLRGFIRGNLRMTARREDYYARNPAERERRRMSLRALLALPPDGVESIERNQMPTTEAMMAAAGRAALPVEVVEQACAGFVFFFGRGGLTPRAVPPVNGEG